MTRKYIYTILIFLCVIMCHPMAYAQDTMDSPIDLGEMTESFNIVDSINTTNYNSDYNDYSANDIFYKFSLSEPMYVTMHHEGTSFPTCIVLLDSGGKSIARDVGDYVYGEMSSIGFISRIQLQKGTYYIVSKGKRDNGIIRTTINGVINYTPNSFESPIDLGIKDSDFLCSDRIKTWEYRDRPENIAGEIFYRFILTSPMYISLNDLGSNYYTSIRLMDTNKNVIASSSEDSYQTGDWYPQSFITEKKLQAGTYLFSIRRNGYDGLLNVELQGKTDSDRLNTDVINIGAKKRSFRYTDQKTISGYNSEYWNKYKGNNTFYKVALTSPMYLSANNEGSETQTRIVLLDENGNELDCNRGDLNNGYIGHIDKKYLLAGIYYVIAGSGSKTSGYTEYTEHKIVTTIEGISDFNSPDVDMGTHSGNFTFSDTQNTDNFYNQYIGNTFSNAVYYNLNLTSAMMLLISCQSQDLSSTRVTIYNRLTGGLVEQKEFNSRNASEHTISMNAGEYILTTDGKIRNGIISLSVEGVKPSNVYDYSISVSPSSNYKQDYYSSNTKTITHKVFISSYKEQPVDVELSYDGSSSQKIYQYLIDIRGNILANRKNLSPGIYYVRTTWPGGTLKLSIKATCKIIGQLTPDIEAGRFDSDFIYSNTENTVNFGDRYSSESNGANVKDIVYGISIKQPMKLSVSHESSNLSKTRLAILDANTNNENPILTEVDLDQYNRQTEIELPIGKYYIISEGYDQNGIITTKIKGTLNNDLGVLSNSFYKQITQNTIYGTNLFEGNKTNDVSYYFKLDRLSNIELMYFAFADTTYSPSIPMQLFIIDEYNNIVYKEQGGATEYKSFPLDKGNYRIVMEGVSKDGIMVLYMQNSKFRGLNELGDLYIGDKKVLLSNTSHLSNDSDRVTYNFNLKSEVSSIELNNIGGDVYIKLADESGKVYINKFYTVNEFIPIENLPKGKYSLSVEGHNDGYVKVNMAIRKARTTVNVNVGAIPYQFSHTYTFNSNTQTTLDQNNVPIDGVFYKIHLPNGGLLDVSQCRKGSIPYYIGMKLYILDKDFKQIAPVIHNSLYSDMTCNKKESNFNINLEQGGIYYIAAVGLSTINSTEQWSSVYETVTTTIAIKEKRVVVDLGRKNTTFNLSEEVDTNSCTNSDISFPTNEVYYKLQLPQHMKLNIDNCGSEVQNTRISIYRELPDNNGFYLSKTSDASDKIDCSGSLFTNLSIEGRDVTLLIGVEGISQNGRIVTNIGGSPNDDDYYGSSDVNYINTRIFLTKDSMEYQEKMQYFDDLGRLKEEIEVSSTPSKADLVTYMEYDNVGRQSRIWQPVSVPSNGGSYATIEEIKDNFKSLYDNDQKPYTLPIYEPSPLNRILKQFEPGQDWHNKNKAASTEHLTNVASNNYLNCIHFSVSETSTKDTILTVTKKTNYNTGELYVTHITDENENISYEFKDKSGLVILTRQIKEEESLDTYYIYDNSGNLRAVLPPIVSQSLQNGSSWNSQTDNNLKQYAYLYKYDGKNRCVAKKLPGCNWIYYVYDKADQLIFTQDGEQRAKGEWLFSIPDALGRPILSGVCTDTLNIHNTLVKGEYTNGGIYKGYNLSVGELSLHTLLTVNYYDNYDYLDLVSNSTNYVYDSTKENNGFGKRYDEGKGYEAKTLLTGTITSTFGSNGNTELYSVMYYDNRQRLIQTHSTNHLNGVDKTYTAYNFTGQPIKMQTVQRVVLNNGQTKNISELYTYSYDHAGRLTETYHQVDGRKAILLSRNVYDELGRLNSLTKRIVQP